MSQVKWDVLNLGNISRNYFWGESDTTQIRSAVCTGTILKVRNTIIVVDPPFIPEKMADLVDRRSGLKTSDIDVVFMTHNHGDHMLGIEAFENAEYFMPKGEIKKFNKEDMNKRPILKKLQPVKEYLIPSIRTIELPGHTDTLCGLMFYAKEGCVVVAGDAVMTRDFFFAKKGYFNSIDFTAASNTIAKIQEIANIVIPGHDNAFIVK